MTPCDDFEARVVDLVTDAVTESARAELLAHANGCAACAALLAEERATEVDLRAAFDAPVPDGLEAMIKARLAEGTPETTRRTSAIRPPASRWLALAAALLLGLGLWGGLRTGRPAATVQAGQTVSTAPDGAQVLHYANAVVWLDANTDVVVGALDREGPALTLRRGRAHVAASPSGGRPFVVHTIHGDVSTPGGALELELRLGNGDDMTIKNWALAGGGVAAAAALFIAVQWGTADVANGHGNTTLGAGERGVVSAGAAPDKALADTRVTALQAELDELRRERDAERAEVKRLKARMALLKAEAKEDNKDVVLRSVDEVRADLTALMKEQGMNLMFLPKDHAMIRELIAMGPEGIKLLGDLLKTGDQGERFGAAALMEVLMDGASIPLLEEAIFGGDNADNVLLQRMASHAVGKIGGEAAVPVLERIVKDGTEWGVQTNAAAFLGEMGHSSGIEWIRSTYHSTEDATARIALLSAMGQIGDPSYLPDLHTVLKEETEYTKRYLAVMGIAKAARQESLPVLESIINNPDEDKMIINEAKKAYDEIKSDD